MASLLDLASDALLGSEEERAERADAGVLGSIQSVAANAGRIFDQSLSMATLFGGVGEGLRRQVTGFREQVPIAYRVDHPSVQCVDDQVSRLLSHPHVRFIIGLRFMCRCMADSLINGLPREPVTMGDVMGGKHFRHRVIYRGSRTAPLLKAKLLDLKSDRTVHAEAADKNQEHDVEGYLLKETHPEQVPQDGCSGIGQLIARRLGFG